MSTEEIDKLLPDRELDALVAERVMGWVWRICYDEPAGEYTRFIAHPDYIARLIKFVKLREPTEADKLPPTYLQLPHYSTDIAAAWEVMAHVMDGIPDTAQFTLHLLAPGSGDASVWECSIGEFWEDADRPIGVGDTAPEAICKAALKVKLAPRAAAGDARAEGEGM